MSFLFHHRTYLLTFSHFLTWFPYQKNVDNTEEQEEKNCSEGGKKTQEKEEKWGWMSVKMDINFLLAMCFDSKFISQTRKSVTKIFFLLLLFLFSIQFVGAEGMGRRKFCELDKMKDITVYGRLGGWGWMNITRSITRKFIQ